MNEKNFIEMANNSDFLPNELEFQLAAKDYLNGKRMPVINCGFPRWNNEFGLLWNQVTGIGGYANYGKGTLARQLMLQIAIKENVNCGAWMPEDMPIEYAYFDLVSTYSGLNTEKPDSFEFVGKKRGMEYLEKMLEMFFIVDSLKWQENSLDILLEVFERLYMEHNCRLFLIDPYKDIEQDSMIRDDFRVHDNILKMRKFAQKFKVHLFVVLHLKRPTTKSGEDPPIPTYNDLHYGAEWSKSLDNMIFYHHPTFFTDRKVSKRIVSIAKCKKRKIQGNGDQFEMEWQYYQNRILDADSKCDLPGVVPNVSIENGTNRLPAASVNRAHGAIEPISNDKLPF